LLGFDFIVPDVTKSPDEQKFGIIECNAVPFINLHHSPLIGEPQNVAGALWDYIVAHEEGLRKKK
jgi:D-alanine-D-alanine ligase-like ATP-grasp enzyme